MDDQLQEEQNKPGQISAYTKEKIWMAAEMGAVAGVAILANAVIGLFVYLKSPRQVTQVAKEGFDDEKFQIASQSSLYSVILSLAINILLFYFLFRFSGTVKTALRLNDNIGLGKGLNNLSLYFKTVGLIIIVMFALVLLMVFAMSMGAALK